MKTIALSNSDLLAIVDDEDFERLNAFNWSAKTHPRTTYAMRCCFGKCLTMHESVMRDSLRKGFVVDHIDMNGLNNVRANLRMCTRTQNNANAVRRINNKSSQFKGVNRYRNGRWRASIQVDYEQISLGYFATELDAARAYDAAALRYFGEFARLNLHEKS